MPVHFSHINDFLTCPKRYELRYIKGLGKSATPSPSLVFGSAFHAGAQAYLLGKDYVATVRDYLATSGLEQADQMEGLTLAVKMLEMYLPQVLGDTWKVIATELLVKSSLRGIELEGTVDAIIEVEGNLILIDWKTRKVLPDIDLSALDIQLPLYAHSLLQMGYKVTEMWQVNMRKKLPAYARINQNGLPSVATQDTTREVWLRTLPKGIDGEKFINANNIVFKTDADYLQVTKHNFTRAKQKWVLEQLKGAVRLMKVKAYPAFPTTHRCQFCQFQTYCQTESTGGDVSLLPLTVEDEGVE